jgi:uncharacterized protein YbjT (DUF2867 family)
MKVAVFGGTGFIGGYLVDELLARGHKPVLLVRPGSESKVRQPGACEMVPGTIAEPQAVEQALRGADAAIYNIGILKEYPKRGVTFDALHFEGNRLAADRARAMGVKRFVLMSANGVKADGTAYQRTKYMAEQYLQSSGLEWTIFRPSVLFGDPRGQMEFATQLYRDIVSQPIPVPLFHDGLLPFGAGSARMSPVHVQDVARVTVASLSQEQTRGQTRCLGGPEELSWKRILEIIGEAVGKRVFGVPVPAWAVNTVADLLQGLDIMPTTRDQITMLMEGNTCDASGLFGDFGIDPTPFDATHLQYLNNR